MTAQRRGLAPALAIALLVPAVAHSDGVLSKPPKLTHFVPAVAPEDALARRGHAEVVLTIDLDEEGRVGAVAVVQPAGDGFDEAAVAAVKQFTFTPGEADGKRVPVRITYQYVFTYKPPPPVEPPAQTENAPNENSPPQNETAPVPSTPTVPFSGRVLSKGDRVPLAGVRVLVDEDFSATTDLDGAFKLDALPVGKHTVRLRGPAITGTENALTLTPGKRTETTYYVPAKVRYSTTVRGTRAVEETVEQTLSAEELKRIPGTQGDTLKAVQNLPGLARSPFGIGLLVVWGSAPNDTRVYVDGIFIPTLYHFGGLRSTVNSEIVQSLTFAPGGYGVEHGRGLGGVIEVESRKPRDDGYHGFAQLDLIDASAGVEGKLSKNVSLYLGARRSWLDAWLPLVTPNDFQLTPTYWDYQARLHWRASASDDVDVFVLGSDDTVHLISQSPDPNLDANFNSHIYYHRAIASWRHRFAGRATVQVTAALGYDVPFQVSGNLGSLPLTVDAETFEYTLRAVARVPLWSMLRLDFGLDFEGNRYTLAGSTPLAGPPREGDAPGMRSVVSSYIQQSATVLTNFVAPFIAFNFSFFDKRLTITPQLRLDIYSWAAYQGLPNAYSHGFPLFEPRLQARYQIKKWMAVKIALGIYHQPPDLIAFLNQFGNPSAAPQSGSHYVFGFDFEPTSTLHIEAEAFYKDLRDLLVRGETARDPPLVSDGIGRVYGGELLVRQELWRNFFGWIAYTVSRSERKDHPDQPWRLFQFDQTHILTLIASYKLPRGYQVGVRFRYVTGNPATPTVPPYGYFDANQGQYNRITGAIYSARLDDFHQLDIRFDKTWTFNRWRLSVYLDLQNIYNNRAPEGIAYNFNFTQNQPIAGLPFLPVLGIRGDF